MVISVVVGKTPKRSWEMSVTAPQEPSSERLVKSTERVRDLGEVFTPAATVHEMLNLLPNRIWTPHPSAKFLEPACGDGNFLVAILDRKLEMVGKEFEYETLPAGANVEAAQFHALEALSSIYAVDISIDNIIGGNVGHEIGARSRLLSHFVEWNDFELGVNLNSKNPVYKAASWIVEHNLIVGNMLPTDTFGKRTGRDDIPLIDYQWFPQGQRVNLLKTTLGDVISSQESLNGDMLNLFPAEEPQEFWSGHAFEIGTVKAVQAPSLLGPARNGTGRREN
jgi:hypothetical protein